MYPLLEKYKAVTQLWLVEQLTQATDWLIPGLNSQFDQLSKLYFDFPSCLVISVDTVNLRKSFI